jgi:hypothetical protein
METTYVDRCSESPGWQFTRQDVIEKKPRIVNGTPTI